MDRLTAININIDRIQDNLNQQSQHINDLTQTTEQMKHTLSTASSILDKWSKVNKSLSKPVTKSNNMPKEV